jgi:uncharacterized protein (TIGR02452 family)
MSLTELAQKTLEIIEAGTYRTPGGDVDVRLAVDAALRETRLYAPGEVEALRRRQEAGTAVPVAPAAATEVTPETTAEACRRLTKAGVLDVLALNFASAKNPGGGFLSGAKAQEEDLARCSALYACQLRARGYYDANRADGTMLYTDHLIYSPRVPFFRDEALELLEEPFFTSIITSPAPNAGEALRRDAAAGPLIREALERRAAHVLAVARAHGHRTLVLGAWGCGVFRNDPVAVAEVFAAHLASAEFAGAFERIVFAVYDRAKGEPNLRAFRARFARFS